MILCDTHADTLYTMGNTSDHPCITPQTLQKGGVTLQVLALWTGDKGRQGDVDGIVAKELDAFESLKQQGLKQVTSMADLEADTPQIMLSVEGGEVFEKGLDTVEAYAQKGVRMAALLWNNENKLGFPAKSGSTQGLTDYGLQVVKEMQRLHMAVDTSHLNEQGFYDLFAKTHYPPMASHSCARHLCDHFRNLTDKQIKLMIASGSYIGINFYPRFLKAEGSVTLADVVHHIDHVCQLGGEGIVGFGSDFDGIDTTPVGLTGPECFPALLDQLKARGYSDTSLSNIAGQNLIAYFARLA